MENGDLLTVYKQFIDKFALKIDNFSQDGYEAPFRLATFYIVPSEVEGECLEWIRRYLSLHECPPGLVSRLTRAVYKRFEDSVNLVNLYLEASDKDVETGDDDDDDVIDGNRSQGSSVDRLYSCRPPDSPSQSYFAIFDGHCGLEAAEYAATHLHWHLVKDQLFNIDTETAMKHAYKTTDTKFLEKAKRESLRSGTTGLSVLIRGSDMYVGWLGDSQVILVRSGQPVEIMSPHKPEREDERRRIEGLGGCVLFNGAWRVNGNISVSRAIGDAGYKPFISSDADVVRVALTGEEECLILACDGLWDVLTPLEALTIVYKHSISSPSEMTNAAVGLVHAARDMGSSDNISVIVVLFRTSLSTPKLTSAADFIVHTNWPQTQILTN